MSALAWVRSKATVSAVETLTIAESSDGTKAGEWRVTSWHYKGALPNKMVYQLKAEIDKLVKNHSGDIQENETLKLGGQYRSDFNKCEFFRTKYEFIA